MPTQARSILFALVLGLALAASASQQQAHEREDGCLGARAEEYLRRHAQNGIIDPEARLYLARETYESLRHAPDLQSDAIGGSTWTSIGPANGAGRIGRVALHPTVSGTMLAGAAGGGIWRTTDSGLTWTPLTDTIPFLFIGAVAYAPSNASRIYVGTGEGDLLGNPNGIGLIWSTDGGATWNFPSSVLANGFFAISVHPTNPDDIIAGTTSGAYRSTSGPNGPWTEVIRGRSDTTAMGYGAVADIDRDPTNANVLYAATSALGTWCARSPCGDPMRLHGPTVLKSTDGGVTWSEAATGLPVSSASQRVGRFAIAIAPSSPSTLYAATSTFDAGTGTTKSRIHKTTNGGTSWSETSISTAPNAFDYLIQTEFDNTIAVSPSDPNTAVAGGVFYVRTTNGGTTWESTLGETHVDVHDLVFDAAGTLYIGNDGGFYVSNDAGLTATARNEGLVTRQFYTLAIDPATPNLVLGGQQDNGTSIRPAVAGSRWTDVVSADGGGCAVDTGVPAFAIAGTQLRVKGRLHRTADVGAAIDSDFKSIFPVHGYQENGSFVTVLTQDATTQGVAYTGTARVWKTTTFGDAWVPLPKTTTDGSVWGGDQLVFDLAVSRSNPRVMMVSTYASIFRTTDGGFTWRRVSSGLPGKVNGVEIDPIDPDVAWAALAMTNGTSIYSTSNGGVSWTARSAGMPNFVALVVRVDPTDRFTIYAGTDGGLFRSTDNGASWLRFGSGLPAAAVMDIRIAEDGSILRAATYGRGVWQLNVTGHSNTPPAATISTPAANMVVARGTTLLFSGNVSDADSGDSVTGRWTFGDTWETYPTPNAASSLAHTFHTAGVYAVGLVATDSHGARGGDSVKITVIEKGDSCASPIVIPATAGFPITATLTGEQATPEPSDPNPLSCSSSLLQFGTMWLDFTPPESGTYQFSLCGSENGTGLRLYTGTSCGSYSAIPDTCLLNFRPTGDCATDSRLTASLTVGVPVHILVTPYLEVALEKVSVTISRATPYVAVTRVTPAAGPTTGGSTVTIYGSGFIEPASVLFGGVAATNVVVTFDGKFITATVPAHAAGMVDLVVTSAGGSATLANAYVYTGGGRRRAAAHAGEP